MTAYLDGYSGYSGVSEDAAAEILEKLMTHQQISSDEVAQILKRYGVRGEPEALQIAYRKKVGQRLIASLRDPYGRREVFSTGNTYVLVDCCNDRDALEHIHKKLDKDMEAVDQASCKIDTRRHSKPCITAQTKFITARCRATFASCWTSLPPCRCQASPASLQPCARVPSRQALSFRTWRRSKNCIRIAGRQFQATVIPFCILAVTSPVRTNMSPKCLAKPQLIPKRTDRRKANLVPTRPISRCPGASC